MSFIKRRGSIIVGTVMLSYMGVNRAWADKAEE